MRTLLAVSALAFGGVAAAAEAGTRPATAVEFHVSPTGSDAAAGTAAAPFATLERARDAVRALKRGGNVLPGPVAVFVRGGVYRLAQPLRLTPEDSGTADAPVSYQAYPGEHPILSGGRVIGGWRRHDDRLWVADVPWAAERPEPFVQFFVDGQRRPRARTPDTGSYLYSKRLSLPDDANCRGLTFAAGDLQPWPGFEAQGQIVLFHNWVNSYNRVGAVDWEQRRLQFARPAGIFFLGPSVRYYVENVSAALDAPGEWFLDHAAGKLYYQPLPGEQPDRIEAVVPVLCQTLLQIRGEPAAGLYVEHLVFRGLSFQHTDADLSPGYAHSVQGADTQRGAVFANGLRHGVFEECEFVHLGEHAISLREGCADNQVRRCHVHDTGGGGVYLSAGVPARADEALLTLRTVVESNFIHDGGHIFRAACGVFLGGAASYNRIVHNDICDLSWIGVHLGWSWTGKAPAYTHHNEVAYNHIHHLGNGVLNDIGGIYTLGVSPGTVLHHNLIHDISRYERGQLGYGGWGIYLDAGSSEIRVEDNVVYDTRDGGLHLHNYGHPYGDLIVNNVFAYAQDAQLIRNADHEPDTNHVHLERNIAYGATPPMLGGSNWKPDSKFTSDRNCFWSETGTPEFNGRPLAEWQKTGRDTNSIVADPGFVDAQQRDFRLRPDSPALALGCRSIDLTDVGLQGPDAWRELPRHVRHRVFEAAPPPAPNWPLLEDAEDYDVGERPTGAVADEGGARVRVTDKLAATGRQCLHFEDAPGTTPWKPHWCAWFEPRPASLRVRCRVRNDATQPATIEFEFRDWPRGGGLAYTTGPHLRLLPDGSVQVVAATAGGWETLGTYPLDQWLDVEVVLTPAKDAPGTWALRLTGPGGPELVQRDGLPCRNLAFRTCTWFGIVGADTHATGFYVDDILLE